MKYLIFIVLLFATLGTFCSQEFKKSVEDIHLTPNLLGTWASSRLKNVKDSEAPIADLFPPVSGFTINYDSSGSSYFIKIQYSEQSAQWKFDSIFLKEDSIIGFANDSNMYIGLYDNKKYEITDVKLIDYNVYGSGIKPEIDIRFSKFSDCIVDCSIESFILDDYFKVFPVTVFFKSSVYTIGSTRKKCSCNGELIGFTGYSDYEINNIIVENNDTTYQLVFYNIKTKAFEKFKLTLGAKNILRKNE